MVLSAWRIRDGALPLGGRTLLMGVVNVTPDSFSDGGRHPTSATAFAHGMTLAREGADILDVGGESTRPGAAPVPVDEEVRRVVPTVANLAGEGLAVSVDTRKSEVASPLEDGRQALRGVGVLRLLAQVGESSVELRRDFERDFRQSRRDAAPGYSNSTFFHGHRRGGLCTAARDSFARPVQ